MIRFAKQRNTYSCGPVAIINALKWAGRNITYIKHFKKIKKLCYTTSEYGTTPDGITNALEHYKKYISFERKELITLREIDQHLSEGGALILEYWFKECGNNYDGHYSFIFRMNEKDFIAVNNMNEITVKKCNRVSLRNILSCKKYRHTGSPSAWLIDIK